MRFLCRRVVAMMSTFSNFPFSAKFTFFNFFGIFFAKFEIIFISFKNPNALIFYSSYGESGMDDDMDRKPKVTIRETLGEDGNVVSKLTNVTSNVVGKVF